MGLACLHICSAGGAAGSSILSLSSFGLSEAPSLEDLEKLADMLFVDPHTLGLQEKTREERGCTLILLFPVCSLHTPPLQSSFILRRHQCSFPWCPLVVRSPCVAAECTLPGGLCLRSILEEHIPRSIIKS